uniref:DUF1618 domain-containing protein n=1 Tax=Leersia perrieri TaxID=77586 RepID=A0A0D9UZ11_9ORYZ
METPTSPSPATPWAILATIPRDSATDAGADLSLTPAAPPRVTILTVPRRISPDPTTPRNFPSVVASDPSGLLLFSATQGRPTGPLVPVIGGDLATLLCFSSDFGEWAEKDIEYPIPGRPWGSHSVISHQGKLWWVDLTLGLLTCDPFDDMPVLRFVPLPEGKALPCDVFGGGGDEVDKCRWVQVSDGKIRFVEISPGVEPRVRMWTLAEPEAGQWAPEFDVASMRFGSYKKTGLTEKIPVLALVHPKNPDVVYFFLEEHLFGADMRAKRVVECDAYELIEPPSDIVSSRFVLAWELPPALTSGRDAEAHACGRPDLPAVVHSGNVRLTGRKDAQPSS